MGQPVNYLSKCLAKVLIGFIVAFLSTNQAHSIFHHELLRGNKINCGLNLEINSRSSAQIRIGNRPKISKSLMYQKYCNIFLSTSRDHLIELQWSYNTLNHFQLKKNQHSLSNRSILMINRKAHHSAPMNETGNLISQQNTAIIRVQKILHLNGNLSIKVNSLKVIRFKYGKTLFLHQSHCLDIYNSLISLEFDFDDEVNSLTNKMNTSNESDKSASAVLGLNISCLVDECVELKLRKFENWSLVAKKLFRLCPSNASSLISIMRSTRIELVVNLKSANLLICLNVINFTESNTVGSERNSYWNFRNSFQRKIVADTKRSIFKRNSKTIEVHSPKEEDDGVNNCVDLNEIPNQSAVDQSGNDSLRCFVVFDNKLDFVSADEFCKKVLPSKYSDVSLANLNTSYALNFIKKFLHRKLFHKHIETDTVEQSTHWTVYNGLKKGKLWSDFKNFTFWANYLINNLEADSANDHSKDARQCVQINLDAKETDIYLPRPTDCVLSPFLCQFTYLPTIIKSSSTSSLSANENCDEHHFTNETNIFSSNHWYKFDSESVSQSGQNCTFRFTAAQQSTDQLELLFTSFHLKSSSFVNSCKFDYIEITVKRSTRSTEKHRLCGNWKDKIKLLRFIGHEIVLLWVSSTSDPTIKREFQARVRHLVQPIEHKSKVNHKANPYPLCSENGNFIFYSNHCYMINFYTQVSYQTAHQVCSEHDANLLTLPIQLTDYYTHVDLIRNLMLQEQKNNQQVSYGDFWIEYNSDKLTNEHVGRDDIDWLSKIDDSLIGFTKTIECLVLTLDDYHYLTDGWLTKSHLDKPKFNSSNPLSNFEFQNVSTLNQLLDLSLIRRVQCDQRAAFVCQKSACKSSQDCNSEFRPNGTDQVFIQPNDLILTSANFPNLYPNSLHQTVLINNTDTQSVYVIQFLHLDIEYQKTCLYDYLSIESHVANGKKLQDDEQSHRNGIRICGRFNREHQFNHPHRHHHGRIGNLDNFTYVTEPGRSLRLTLKTDYSIRGKGFKIELNRIRLNWCQTNLSLIQLTSVQSTLAFHTPGYPQFTIPNLDCKLIIKAESSNHRILFNLLDIQMNENESSPLRAKKHCLDRDNYFALELSESRNVKICSDYVQQLDDILLKQISPKSFVSFNSSLVIRYRSFRRLFGDQFETDFKGLKFSVSSMRWNSTISLVVPLEYSEDSNQIVSNKSITLYSFSKLQLVNYPFSLPDGLNATIYIRGPINYNIELRSPKDHFFDNDYRSIYLTYTNCRLHTQHNQTQVIVRDNFAHLRFSPAKPEQWNLCLEENNFPISYYNQLKQTKMIKSNLHLLNINMKMSFGWTPAPFYLRLVKDINLINKTHMLPVHYPIDSCLYRPCENEGNCIRNQIKARNQTDEFNANQDTYRCVCPKGWYGIFCSLRICDLKPCAPNGQCAPTSDHTNYTCHCYIGYAGKHCTDTVATCDQDRGNPCKNRGHCFLVNGMATCKCFKYYDGKYCEKPKIRIAYKPLSERMVDEPFWLGLLAVLVVLFFISLVYLLKKKFAERIEQFFAQEIERSKTQSAIRIDSSRAGNRYSLTSNLALNLNNPSGSQQCLMRSHSSMISKLNNCKQSKYQIKGGHSDTECNTKCQAYSAKDFLEKPEKKDGYFSDTEYLTNRKRIPTLLMRVQKIVNSTSSGSNARANTLRKDSELNRSFEKQRRYSLYDFVIRRQSNNLFDFDFKQATDKLTGRKKGSKKDRKMKSHSKSSTDNDEHLLRVPSAARLANNPNVVPRLVFELGEFDNSDVMDSLPKEDASRLNLMHTSNSMLNYQVITENSQEDEQDASVQAAELSNLENLELQSSFSSEEDDDQSDNLKLKTDFNINFNTKFQRDKKIKIQTKDRLQPSKSVSPIPHINWTRSQSEQQHYEFYSPPPSLRHPSDRYFKFDTSPGASTRRKKFANYKQYSCLNLGDRQRNSDCAVKFINDERMIIDTNSLFVNTDYPARRLSAPSGQQTIDNRQQLPHPLSSQQLTNQQNINNRTSPRAYKATSRRCFTLDDTANFDLPRILINDEQNLPNLESVSSEQIYGTPEVFDHLNVPIKSLARLSSPEDFSASRKRARIQKSYSAGNNYHSRYDELISRHRHQQMALSRMRSAQDFDKIQSIRSKSPRQLRSEIKRNESWPANMSTFPIKRSSLNYSSSSSSSSVKNAKPVKPIEFSGSNARQVSPHLIQSKTHKFTVQQSLPTPSSGDKAASCETFWPIDSNLNSNSVNRKLRSPKNRKSPIMYPLNNTTYQLSSSKPTRCYSANNRDMAKDSMIETSIYQTAGELKFLKSLPLYRTRSFNATTNVPAQFLTLKKQHKRMNKLSSSSPTTASSSPGSDVNSEIRWRNAIETSNYFNSKILSKPEKAIYKPEIYKPGSQLRPKSPKRTVMRSNSDEKAVTNRIACHYYGGGRATRRKSRSFEQSPDEEIVLIPSQQLTSQQQATKKMSRLKSQSSSDTVLVDPMKQLNLNQMQQAFSLESIHKDLNEDTEYESNNNSDKPDYDLSHYIKIANKAQKSVTKEEVKNLSRKLEPESSDCD